MSRPVLEVADIFRAWMGRYIDRNGSRISWPQLKVIRAVERCRTAALGRHRDRCTGCGKDFGFSFNSCRNRHCPKCQTERRNRWVAARTRELVPLNYFHIVFTVPHQLSELMLQNKRLLYDLLFRCVSTTLLEVAANPKRLGAEIGFLCVLHTWGQTLIHHPHIHCVVPAGGFAPGRTRWVHPKCASFFLPKTVLSEVFRGKFTEALKGLYRQNTLAFHGSLAWLREPRSFARFLQTLHVHKWVVYVKKPFGGPEHVLHYLARYTHRVAISNHRLLDMEDGKVTFRWKDYAHAGKQRKMTLVAEEFIRRVLLHVLPKGFVRIRQYGWMANLYRLERVAECRALLAAEPLPSPTSSEVGGRRCTVCGGIIEVVEMISRAGYRVGGPAEDVHRIPLRTSLLLADHAGRGARKFEVCPRVRAYSEIAELPRCRTTNQPLLRRRITLRRGPRTIGRAPSEYQNPIPNPYGPLPHPPQTQAAHFKRLYRK